MAKRAHNLINIKIEACHSPQKILSQPVDPIPARKNINFRYLRMPNLPTFLVLLRLRQNANLLDQIAASNPDEPRLLPNNLQILT
jgi:hypothetical protein